MDVLHLSRKHCTVHNHVHCHKTRAFSRYQNVILPTNNIMFQNGIVPYYRRIWCCFQFILLYLTVLFFFFSIFLLLLNMKTWKPHNRSAHWIIFHINILLWLLVRLAAKRYRSIIPYSEMMLLFFYSSVPTLLCISLHGLCNELKLKLLQQ